MPEERELSDYFEWLESEFGQRLRASIAWRFPSLTEADIEDVYQETMQAILVRWREQPNTRDDRAIGGLLKGIAKHKACDFLNKRAYSTGTLSDVDNLGDREDLFAVFSDTLEREEIGRLIAEGFDQLPDEEKHVWDAYAKYYPRSEKYTKLAMFAGMPGRPRRAARLLKNARSKIIQHLKTKGYDLE